MKANTKGIRLLAAIIVVSAVITVGPVISTFDPAGADTSAGTIVGEGGDAMNPVITRLLHDDTGLQPDFGSYTNTDIDQGIADFVGTAPSSFGADFVMTERALTPSEAATAAKDGRSFAYVPFAASPVALMTLELKGNATNPTTIDPAEYCQHIDLNVDQLDGIYGAPSYTNWGDSHLSCPGSPPIALDPRTFNLEGNLDPTMENYALMSLLDSTTASENAFQANLATQQPLGLASTTNPAASEKWPFSSAVPQGDQATLGKILDLNARTLAPTTQASLITLGTIMPIDAVWTGNPLGVTWNFPTAAVQNAESAYVPPSASASAAAEADATLAATSDPTTNNVVTFIASTSDAAAYNNDLMLESYLVVPTNGLPADKARSLAQLIRFAVGNTGQSDITALGAAPATPKMVTADLAVAQQLDVEASTASTSSTTTTTTAGSGSGSGGGGTANSGSSNATPTAATTAATGNSGSGSAGLAATGDDPLPLVATGLTLLIGGESARRWARRRRAKT